MQHKRLVAPGPFAPVVERHQDMLDTMVIMMASTSYLVLVERGGMDDFPGCMGLRARQIRCFGLYDISTTANHTDSQRLTGTALNCGKWRVRYCVKYVQTYVHIFIIVNNAPTTKQRQTKVLASPSFPFAASRLPHARGPLYSNIVHIHYTFYTFL